MLVRRFACQSYHIIHVAHISYHNVSMLSDLTLHNMHISYHTINHNSHITYPKHVFNISYHKHSRVKDSLLTLYGHVLDGHQFPHGNSSPLNVTRE